MIMAKAPAKAILLGEYSVMNGNPAIAATVDERTYVSINEREEDGFSEEYSVAGDVSRYGNRTRDSFFLKREEVYDNYKIFEDFYTHKKFDELGKMGVKEALCVLYQSLIERMGYKPIDVEVRQSRELKGLGGSASTFSAFVSAYAGLMGKDLSKQEVANIANMGDIICHGGEPSGTDPNIICHGGFGVFDKKNGFQKLDIDYEIPMVIVNTGEISETSKGIEYVRRLKEEEPELVDDVMANLGSITEASLEDLRRKDLAGFGNKMYSYYDELSRLEGLLTPKLKMIMDYARDNALYGAKPTGSWQGGNCIILASDANEALNLEYRLKEQKIFEDVFVTNLGVEGVKVDERMKGLKI